MAKKQKRNPPDSTLRNTRAGAKRDAKHDERLADLEQRVAALEALPRPALSAAPAVERRDRKRRW